MNMSFMNSINSFFDSLSKSQFYQILAGFFGTIFFIVLLYCWFYFRTISSLKNSVQTVTELRRTTRKILDRVEQVSRQRTEVDDLLAQDDKQTSKALFLRANRTDIVPMYYASHSPI
jgi:Na+/melibiose symporter-like transporter